MNEIFQVTTNSEEETMLFGEKLAHTVGRGVVFTLLGDLGAGKTHFVKGFVKGIGSNNLVTSPTFTLLNVYEGGKVPVYHFDMYRLSSKEEAEVFVEWPNQVEGLINCPHIEIKIDKIDDNKRKITVSSVVEEIKK